MGKKLPPAGEIIFREAKFCEHPGCAKEALCGIGVHLSRGIRGRWFCFPHYKERIVSDSLPLFEKSGQTGRPLSRALGSGHNSEMAAAGFVSDKLPLSGESGQLDRPLSRAHGCLPEHEGGSAMGDAR